MVQQSTTELQRILLAWIKRQMNENDLTDEEVASAIGVNRAVFNKLKNGTRPARWSEVVKLSHLFSSEPPTHLPLVSGNLVRNFISLRQNVALDVWRRAEAPMSKGNLEVRQIANDAYEGLEQYARLVEDEHASTYVLKGFYLICVDYQCARPHPIHGDYVVIERRRAASDRTDELLELSVRQLVRRGGGWSLRSLADASALIPDIPYDGDTPNLRICDLIIARHADG